MIQKIILGALGTVLTLFGGLLVGVVVGNIVFELLPGHSVTNINPLYVIIAALPAIAGLLSGCALWGVLMGRMADAPNRRRMAWAGLLGFAPITIVLGIVLQIIEPIALREYGDWLPLHRLFTLLFVPTAFLITGVGAWAIGIGLRDQSLAWTLLWRAGLAAALAFLTINLIMEASGWVVGAPRAAERFTMLTVMFVGNLGAALAGGAVIGYVLASKPNSSNHSAL